MNEVIPITSAVVGLAAAAIGIGHAKSKGQSVLVHHATHNDLLPNKTLNKVVGELVGLLTLNADLKTYRTGADEKSGHLGHHGKRFATAADEESQFVLNAGYRPGMTRVELWRQHWRTVFSPAFHSRQFGKRLRLTFAGGPPWRRATAWLMWGGLLAAAGSTGQLAAVVLGLLLPLVVVGQVASWYEQVTEHRWLVSSEPGRTRHTELSHGRFLGAMPPADGKLLPWLRFWWRTLGALLGRVLVVPSDLPHHSYHHRLLDLQVVTGMVSWTDSAQAHSPILWLSSPGEEAAYATLHEAVDAWFTSLAEEPADDEPQKPSRAVEDEPNGVLGLMLP